MRLGVFKLFVLFPARSSSFLHPSRWRGGGGAPTLGLANRQKPIRTTSAGVGGWAGQRPGQMHAATSLHRCRAGQHAGQTMTSLHTHSALVDNAFSLSALLDQSTQDALLGMFVLSGLSKVALPGALGAVWPRLPQWFWVPCGLWEIVAAASIYLNVAHVGYDLLYTFLGGVFCSLIWIKDEGDETLFEKAGSFGPVLLAPATATLGLLATMDTSEGVNPSWLASTLMFATLGFMYGAVLGREGVAFVH